MKFSPSLALTVCRGIESGTQSGAGYARIYSLDEKEICLWLALYRLYGPDVFEQDQTFHYADRLRIVEDKLRDNLTLKQTCLKYKIPHRSSLRNWIRLHKDGRLEDMAKKERKQKIKEKPADGTVEVMSAQLRDLERELRYARAEIDYLKKLRALMQETEGLSTD